MRVLALGPVHRELAPLLAGIPGLDLQPVASENDLLDQVGRADAIVADWTGSLQLPAAVADRGQHVKLVQYPGAGVHSIDVCAWRERGAQVCATPGANSQSVAEWAVTAAGFLCRWMGPLDEEVRRGSWPRSPADGLPERDLGERTVGILGMGSVGTRCASLFAAFGCRVVAWSRSPNSQNDVHYLPLEELLARADVLVLSLPLSSSTEGIIGADELSRLPSGAVVVNVGRGPLVDDVALAECLASGRLAGAAIDVFNSEPPAADEPLLHAPGVLLSPHAAGGSGTARRRVFEAVKENLLLLHQRKEMRWRL